MSTRTINLPHEISVTVAQPYETGHVLTDAEAAKLNQVLADSVRAALNAKLKKLSDDSNFDAAATQGSFQSFADAYSFSIRSTKSAADPVEKEAHKLAKEQVFAAIRKKNGNPRDYSEAQIAEYIALVLTKKPEIREEAARRVNSSRQIAGDLLEDLIDEAA